MWGQATADQRRHRRVGTVAGDDGRGATGVLATAASTAVTRHLAAARNQRNDGHATYGLERQGAERGSAPPAWLAEHGGRSLISGSPPARAPVRSPSSPWMAAGTNAAGTWCSFTGSGAGLTGIQFSQLLAVLWRSSQFSGTYGSAVTLSNTSNVYYGNGSNLTGVVAGPGSPYYIQNGTSQQASSNFNISGTAVQAAALGNAVNSTRAYQIGGTSVLSHWQR